MSLGVCGFLACAEAFGETTMSLPVYDLPAVAGAARATTSDVASGRGSAILASPQVDPARASIVAKPTNLLSRFALVEFAGDATPSGAYRRPHHGLGYRWGAAESWLRDHGFEAQTCYLPMVRLHTSMARNGSVSGTLWVYGRCTFR
jgi:hypothetical protein